MRNRPSAAAATAIVLLLATVPALFVLTSAGAESMSLTLANGGAGPNFDPITYRGKYFQNAEPGTLTKVCAYAQHAGTSATVAVRETPYASTNFTVVINFTEPSAWSCTSIDRSWSASTLFLFKLSGNASIGYDSQPPHDSRYSWDNGGTWGSDAWRRGYKVDYIPLEAPTPPTPPSPPPPTVTKYENGGAGPGFDNIVFRGKQFGSVTPGTITEVCAYAQTAGTTLTVGLKATTDNLPAAHTVAIPVTASEAWNCASVALPWTDASLLVYKMTGTAAVGYDSGTPRDSRYSDDNGLTWGSDAWRRGYTVTIES